MIIAIALLTGGCARKSHWLGPAADHYSASLDSNSRSTAATSHHKVGSPYRVAGRWYYPLASAAGYDETGTASWYGDEFHGKATANGELYDMHAMSAAHTTLPMPTLVRVTNLENGRSVVVRVNDRGPFVKNRLIDLSYAAARALGYEQSGTARVRVQALAPATGQRLEPAVAAKATRAAASSPMGRLFIQLGAFASAENAGRLENSLKQRYANAHIVAMNQGSDRLYKVRIGPYSSEKALESGILDLQLQGYRNAIVVMDQ